ncbi:hypothetical protein IFO70_00230 [Phormidium tenue FACHB-886]|nr:hypothetical protein [Phormidium tenue FACHB-886]
MTLANQAALSVWQGNRSNSSFCLSEPSYQAPPIRDAPHQPQDSSMPTGLMAGVAIALAAGAAAATTQSIPSALLQPTQPPPQPQHEGSFQIRLESAVPTSIAAPEVFSETQRRVLESPRLLDPIVAEHTGLTYETLSQNLDITLNLENQLEVHYRDSNAERTQQVLQDLSQAYLRYSQECQTSSCRGAAFIEAKIPVVEKEIASLQTQIQRFYEQNGIEDLATQTQLFDMRATELTNQAADIEVQIAKAVDQFNALQTQMGLPADDAITVTLLKQNAGYQALLPQLRSIDQQIATELSRFGANSPDLQALYTRHHDMQQQLAQAAQQALEQSLAQPDADLSSALQEPPALGLLQQSIGVAHYLQVLQIRQQTIAQTDSLVQQQRHQLAALLRQEDALQQQLNLQTGILQGYQDELAILQPPLTPAGSDTALLAQPPVWKLATQPHLSDIAPRPSTPELSAIGLQSHILMGTLLGVGITVAVSVATQQRKDSAQHA